MYIHISISISLYIYRATYQHDSRPRGRRPRRQLISLERQCRRERCHNCSLAEAEDCVKRACTGEAELFLKVPCSPK